MPGPTPPGPRLSDTPRPHLEPKPHPYLLQRRPQAPPLTPRPAVIPGPALSLSPASPPGPRLCPAPRAAPASPLSVLPSASVLLLMSVSPPCPGHAPYCPAQPSPCRLLFLFVLPHSPFSSARLFALPCSAPFLLPWLHSSIYPLQSLLPPSTITSVHPG